jgi:hypothetical protein
MQDVLHESETATLDDVGPLMVEQADCGFCGDSGNPMCRVRVYPHVFREDCLTDQLAVEHECRYRCALCRAEFFSLMD